MKRKNNESFEDYCNRVEKFQDIVVYSTLVLMLLLLFILSILMNYKKI
jgi:hypothetical protein